MTSQFDSLNCSNVSPSKSNKPVILRHSHALSNLMHSGAKGLVVKFDNALAAII